jgi:hypothetical protein
MFATSVKPSEILLIGLGRIAMRQMMMSQAVRNRIGEHDRTDVRFRVIEDQNVQLVALRRRVARLFRLHCGIVKANSGMWWSRRGTLKIADERPQRLRNAI